MGKLTHTWIRDRSLFPFDVRRERRWGGAVPKLPR